MVARRDFAGGAAATTLAADINATATIMTIASGTGWPTGANGEFYICIDRGKAGEEKCLVLSRSGTTLTLASAAKRGKDGTSAASHSAGVTVEHVGTAADLDEANAFIADPGDDGDISDSAPGDVADAGATGKWADAGHVHGREDAAGTVYFTNLGAALSQSFTTEVDLTGLTTITFTADGTSRYRLHFHGTAVGASTLFKLYEGATLLAILTQTTTTISVDGWWEWVPTAGSHTYKIRGLSASGTGRLDTNQASGQDTYVSVENIGAV